MIEKIVCSLHRERVVAMMIDMGTESLRLAQQIKVIHQANE